jgi:hypothetical protein
MQGITNARTPLELAEASGKLLSFHARPKPAPIPEPVPAEKPAEAIVAEPATPEVTPETATVPDPEAPASSDPEAPATPEPEEAEDDEPGDTAIKAGKIRVRLPENDDVGREAMTFLKRNRDWTLEQAMEAARQKLGIEPETAPEATIPTPLTNALPNTVESVNAEISKLQAQKKEAATALRVEEMADIDDKIDALRDHRLELRETQRETTTRQKSQAATEYAQGYEASEQLAVETYRFASVPTSEAGKRMAEIDAALERNNDPLFNDPNKPMIVAQMVAREFSIAPMSKNAAKPGKPAPVVPPAPAQKKGILPSGSDRTAAPTTPSTPNAEVAQIAGINQMKDLKAFYKSKGINI